MARKVEDKFSKKLKRKSRGIKQASLWVMHNTYMPSVLIETGFITNKKEGAYLNSRKGQSSIATAIKDAIIDYKKELDQNVGSSILGANPKTIGALDDIPLIYEGITFKVQIAASSKSLEPKSYNFNGLSDISREQTGKIYKYFSGSTSDYNELKQLQDEAKSRGFPDAFIVAYKDGKQISVSEAIKGASN